MSEYYYEIYQVKIEEDFAFMDWKRANKFFKWSFEPYKWVWSGFEKAEDDYDLLNRLFVTFNINHPVGFKGHSMSVSDVIKINHTVDENKAKYYFCDAIGWKDITEIIKGEE